MVPGPHIPIILAWDSDKSSDNTTTPPSTHKDREAQRGQAEYPAVDHELCHRTSRTSGDEFNAHVNCSILIHACLSYRRHICSGGDPLQITEMQVFTYQNRMDLFGGGAECR
eukprot:g33183.t1